MMGKTWPVVSEAHRGAIRSVLEVGQLTMGGQVEHFEAEFADYCGVAHAVMCASGTHAIEIGLRAVAPSATYVACPGYTFAGSALPIFAIGATPVWVDLDETRGVPTVWPTERISAAVRVHLHGHPTTVEIPVPVVDDCAQAAGTSINGQPLAAYLSERGSKAQAWSLNATKMLWAGEGGVLTTDDPDVAQLARDIRHFGGSARFTDYSFGLNSKPDEIRAALARVSLYQLDQYVEVGRAAADELQAFGEEIGFRGFEPEGERNGHKLFMWAEGKYFPNHVQFKTIDRWQTVVLPDHPGLANSVGDTPRARKVVEAGFVVGTERYPLALYTENDINLAKTELRQLALAVGL